MGWEYFKVDKKISINNVITAFKLDLNKGFVFSGEMHNFWEMFVVLEGNAQVSADERIYNLSKNQIIFHKPMELHKFEIKSDSKIFVTSFTLHGEYKERFKNLTMELSAEQKNTLEDIVDLLDKNKGECENIHDKYLEGFKNNPLLLGQTVSLLEYFLMTLCENKNEVSLSDDSLIAETFKKAVIFMEENATEWLSLPQIASHLNISVSYLKKVFFKYTGLGAHKYFLKIKMIYACKMLKKGKSINEIANSLNFSSQNYFSNVFKREIGISPTEFKNKNRHIL